MHAFKVIQGYVQKVGEWINPGFAQHQGVYLLDSFPYNQQRYMAFSAQTETVLFGVLCFGASAFIIEGDDDTLFADTKKVEH